MDLQVWRDAGLYDPTAPGADERRELLQFLESEGCTLEEMQVAARNGRLFALAGDRRIRPVVGLLSLHEAATRLETDPVHLLRVWRSLGLTVKDVHTPALAEPDIEALQTYLDIETILGHDMAHAFARVVGASMARITDAVSAAMRMGVEAISLERSQSEVVTAKSFSELTKLVPRVGAVLDALHRQHLEATRVFFEDIDVDATDRSAFICGIGFADLSDFTHIAQHLQLGELSQVLSAFEEEATDVVQQHDGRIVKFLGDAVMWVSARPESLVAIAWGLVNHPHAREHGIEVKAGIAFGSVLAQDGDYFGTPVNLASRLVAVAGPGQVLTAGDLVALLKEDAAEPREPVELRGFHDPVTPYVLKRPAGA